MRVIRNISKDTPLTEEQLNELREALKHEPVCDSDCPEVDPETERALYAAALQRNWMKRLREENDAI